MSSPIIDYRGAVSATASGRHGEVRGLESTGRSTQFEGRFGRMFRTLPPARFTEGVLRELAGRMTADPDPLTPETEADEEENIGTDQDPGISAGYTYLGQFIDHDLTFDPASSLERQNDPDALVDYRTPRFDLDCVYGRGPDDQPYLYRKDGRKMLLGTQLTGNPKDPGARTVARITPEGAEPARAVIGDPRNDENVIVSQLQSSMIRFHNHMADVLGASADFETTQRMVRWHYQYVVVNDFLPTIIGQNTFRSIMGQVRPGDTATAQPPQLHFYKPEREAFMPVEFSVAAYRFGHSMIRPVYRLNGTINRVVIFGTAPAGDGKTKPEPVENDNLRGFRKFPDNWAIDWSLFFRMGTAPKLGKERVQPAYKIDSSLVNPLGTLPPEIAQNPPSLAERNLLRGWRMSLPSGQSVARRMGIQPIPDKELKVGKATEGDSAGNPSITDISPTFAGNAPLWFYILSEAQHAFQDNNTAIRLGPVGGRIVGEVFIGLLMADTHSYLRQNPGFKPISDFTQNGQFRMAELLRAAAMA